MIGKFNGRPITVIASVKEDDDFLYPEIFIGDDKIYKDSSTTLYNLKGTENQIISLKNSTNQFYILLETLDPPKEDKWVILEIKDNKVIANHKVIKQYLKDIDNDGYIEVGGFEISEAYCTDCDSAYYNPAQIYKLADKLQFDQSASEIVTKEVYGVYLGNKQSNKILKVIKK